MKKLIPLSPTVIIIAALLMLVYGCSKPAGIVCTESLPATVSTGASVLYSGCGSALGTYTWTFGDGGTATGDSVVHAYTTAGTYSGSVNLTNLTNNVTKTFTVKVINDSWTFNGVIYGADSVTTSSSGGLLLANGSNGNITLGLDFVFQTLPSASGSYTVVAAKNGVVAAGQVYVTVYEDSAGTKKIYGSTGSGSVSTQITVANGQISASLPSIAVVNQSNASDSTTLSANITQLP